MAIGRFCGIELEEMGGYMPQDGVVCMTDAVDLIGKKRVGAVSYGEGVEGLVCCFENFGGEEGVLTAAEGYEVACECGVGMCGSGSSGWIGKIDFARGVDVVLVEELAKS